MLSGAGFESRRAVRVGKAGGERTRDASVSKHAPAPKVPANMCPPQLELAPCVLRLSRVTQLHRRDDLPKDMCWLRGDGWCLTTD